MAMNTRVTAEAWTRVSRSGHWTRFSSAQQETRKPITAPRWRSCGSAAACRRFSDSLRRRSRSFSSRRRSLRLIRSGAASGGAPTSARDGAGAGSSSAASAGASCAAASSGGAPFSDVEVRSVLGQLRLDHLGRLRHLGALLGTAVRAPVELRLASGPRLSRSPLCLSLRPSLRHRYTSPRSAGLLVRGVPATPVAVLAQLEPIGSVATRLVRLVVASLALLAGERDGDSDFSAGHWLVVFPLGPGGRRSQAVRPFSEKRPRPSHCGEGARGARRIAPRRRSTSPPAAPTSPSVLAMMLRWISEVPP